eukprot:sb/3471697/
MTEYLTYIFLPGRGSAEQTANNNNDSLSSSGVYSEEERKLNLKARLENEYDNLDESIGAPRTGDTGCQSPDSDNGDIYENIPNVIRQGQQVHSDGLTMQSIAIQGAADTGRFEEGQQSRWGDMIQSSLSFAYGPGPDQSSEYTSLREAGAKEGQRPVAPIRTTSTVRHSDSQHSISTDV